MIRPLAAALLLLVLTACGSDQPSFTPAPPDVDVDTPSLRKAKARIGMADCEPGAGDGPVEGGLPSLVLPCLGGGPDVDLATLRGPVVINLWQAFCGPCREEMPALQAFHEQHGDRVPVLGIDYNDVRPEAALELAEETGARYPSLADPGGELTGRDGFPVIRGLPTFVLVDAEGRVAEVSAGGIDSVEEVEAMVAEHLGVAL